MNSFVLLQSSLIPLLLITSFLSINFQLSVCADDTVEYANCSQLITCGSVKSNISYPFWGANRPEYCGKSGFEVTCEANVPVITMRNIKFRILDMSNSSTTTTTPTVKVARQDYWEDICPSTYVSTTLDFSLFAYSSGLLNVSIWYGCNATVTVTGNSYPCNSSIAASYLTQTRAINVPIDPVTTGACQYKVLVPVFESASEALDNNATDIETAIDGGFELDVLDADNGLCTGCLSSGGVCGQDTTVTNEFKCFCQTTSSSTTTCIESSSPSPTSAPSGKNNQIPIGLAVGGAILFGIFVGFYAYFVIQRKKKKRAAEAQSKEIPTPLTSKSTVTPSTNLSQSQSIPSYPSFNSKSRSDLGKASTYFGVQVFSYAELEEATENFNPAKELGDGGFGTVYYGKLHDGRVVAVKRLYENNFKRVEQFMNEVEILTRLEHQNLVKLYGCTSRRSRELLLVYEYISNGTVADHLHGKRMESGFLSWPVRLSIAIETADALAFLHRNDVIHRDVKTNNILLDDDFCVKVADFGLSRLFPNDQTHVSTAPQGTPGYVDPEYYQCYQLTDKSDVYSFGVVLIELISSLQAVDTNRHRHDINLANMAINKIQNHLVNELVDPLLGYDKDYSVRIMATAVAELAFRCLQQEKDMRPTMEEVLEGLKAIQNEDLGAQENGEAEAVVLDIGADEVGLLRNLPPPLSPDSVVTDKLILKRWDRTM
ncbi:LEAF RUST 10 DISEASE-RESISTANCE LOCUS RECEPTOR-LIKE PROTEIN KINASE-like 1.3 isoform X2 [Rosa chinensis]|uniref:LEAF RUST 10 DISEASE-RESISTANCE LOCUS RECEPTOR-LIKE PROTEIN KINASE-like 1.3 isoform X2 n=1 Tax=Rosa chinensis TaxID=74649 RepID=UPI000D08DB61|nr:LEAF RUST 10 DISEASE-RESISTANCE LOCUS RECEPTOR-LIKE PROTEIN KINASE-like 1.3 isoform X2 [Rosa chinensis]